MGTRCLIDEVKGRGVGVRGCEDLPLCVIMVTGLWHINTIPLVHSEVSLPCYKIDLHLISSDTFSIPLNRRFPQLTHIMPFVCITAFYQF